MNLLKKSLAFFPEAFLAILCLGFILDLNKGDISSKLIAVILLLLIVLKVFLKKPWLVRTLSIVFFIVFGVFGFWGIGATLSEYHDVVEAGPAFTHELPALLGVGMALSFSLLISGVWMLIKVFKA